MQALIIGYVWPEPASSAAGKRMVQLLELLLDNNYKVTFATPAASTSFMADLDSIGIRSENIAVNDPRFDKFILELQPSIVVFDRFMMEEQFGWRVAKQCPDAVRILDTEDLHFLRKNRESQFSGKQKTKHSALASREIASIYRCDQSLIISEVEMKLLTTQYKVPRELLFYLPFLHEEIIQSENDLPTFEARKNFIFIGNMRHAPNIDAVIFLKEKIWPLIFKELPDTEMHIYGAYASSKIDRLHDPNLGFHIKGRAENAGVVVKNSRVSLVPLRFGAGLKGKLTEAMICGTPSVTTSIGAEGINGSLPWSGTITNDPEEFAAAAITLHENKEIWKIAKNNGFEIINSRFSKRSFAPLFIARLIEITQGLTTHRDNNFTGTMLMHHRVQSTYYLSKYIESKTELERLRQSIK